MKKIQLFTVLILLMLLVVACKKKDTTVIMNDSNDFIHESATPSQTVSITKEPVNEKEQHDGEVKSKLTGRWVSEEIANQRPYAIMFNNIKYASPQSGTSEAAILYEAIVEGGITRLMGIFEQITTERIGSVRSARHYFVSVADEYDAIFVHYGQTKYATSKIEQLGVDNLSGLTSLGSTVFYRDHSLKAPHNAFASLSGLIKGTNIKKYDTSYDEDYQGHFKFYEEDTLLSSDKAVNKLILNFSNYTSPYFIYNKETKEYVRFQFGSPHIDANNKKQLGFKNIIIQYVKEWNIDKNGYQTMDIEDATGDAYYITNGKAMDITWKKNESSSTMRYYDLDGNELIMNPGKTYIALFPNDRKSDVIFSER